MDRERRRRFGQNFLDKQTADLIASDLPLSDGESILEIGPGHGALTEPLLSRGFPLTAVEIDEECVAFLKEKFTDKPDFSIVNQNFLQFPLEAWLEKNPKSWLTGNLPYNISTGIVSKIMPILKRTKGFMGMVQYEVAKRFCAEPHSSDYGSLSVWVKAHAEGRILRKIGPEHFTPRPNVDSATVLLLPLEHPLEAPPDFFTFVQAAFSKKRKLIVNSLSNSYGKSEAFAALEKCGFSMSTRAEELSPQELLNLYTNIKKK
ncbi:MAG: 16S rRNA (adenine(1518)-N(6)/adenine(1519)-N(6))-dimethyltransferase RsmA [Fibrobacteraceae bacterium]|nr:16S rRNA (adenine(1518)-N(6)/adenine(1519)-N(6))-dimethyltransferase RsmA [Fibrobacteraceae bacterium]